MAFLTTQEIYLLKALMSYIGDYKGPPASNLTAKLSPEQKNKLSEPLKTSAKTINDLILSDLTAEQLKEAFPELTPELLLNKRIHDIKRFLEGPELGGWIPNFILIRWRGRNQEVYENFVNDVKSVMDTQKEDIINYYNAEKTDPKERLDPQTNIRAFSGFDYDTDVKTNPGLQMYAILNDFRKPGMMSKMFNKLPRGSDGLVFLKKIFQPNIIRDLVLLAAFIGVMATFGYIIAGLAIGVSFGAVIASSGAISMFSMAPIGAYFTGACAFDYFRKEPHTPSAPVKMVATERNLKQPLNTGPEEHPNTGPGHGFQNAHSSVSTLTTLSGTSALDSSSRRPLSQGSPRPSITDIDE